MNQKEIIKTLKEGNERFKANKEINHDYSQASLKEFEKDKTLSQSFYLAQPQEYLLTLSLIKNLAHCSQSKMPVTP